MSDPLHNQKFKRGEKLPHAKLDERDVRNIRELVDHREKLRAELKHLTNQAIASKFEVHQRTIDKVVAGYTWGHVV